MAADPIGAENQQAYEGAYLKVVRLEDGRYCVQFLKYGVPPRTSYTAFSDAVIKQAQRAGNIPIHTDDRDLQRMCQDNRVELISWPS